MFSPNISSGVPNRNLCDLLYAKSVRVICIGLFERAFQKTSWSDYRRKTKNTYIFELNTRSNVFPSL